MARLLFLSQRIPYPPNKGEKIRHFQILRHLCRSFDVHLGTLIDDPADWAHVETVRAMCADSYFAPFVGKWRRLAGLRGLLSGEPLSVTFFRDAKLQRWVDKTLAQVRPDVVFVCSSNMAPYVLDHPLRGEARMVDLADVDSEKWRLYSRDAKGPMRWVYRREARLTLELERRIGRDADASTFVSEVEAALFRRLVPDAADRVHAVSNGVDFQFFDPAHPYAAPYDLSRPTFVFTGTMNYRPNIDAAVWFTREILPIIRRALPQAQFYIVGSAPSRSVLKLAEVEGVHVTGRVADVRPFVAHATACVAPLRIARGIQNKVLEAMAMARPTIVTPDALEGIEAEPEREVFLAADAAEFAAAAIRAARYPDEARRIGAAARHKVERRYSWMAQLAAYDWIIGRSDSPSFPDIKKRSML